MPSARTATFGVVAITLATGLTLAAVEGSLRVYHLIKARREEASLPPVSRRCLVPSNVPGLILELNPGWSRDGFTVNRYGMADDDVTLAKPADVFRIAFAGDSITCNWELVPRNDTYVKVFDRLANERQTRGPRIQSLNFGVNSYSLLQTAAAIRAKALRFAPNLVVVQLCLNDPYPSDTTYDAEAPFPGPMLQHFIWRRVQPDRFWAFAYVERYYDERGWENMREGLREIAALARPDRPVVAVLFPYLYEPAYRDWGFARFHDRIRREAEAAGVPLLDLRDAFEHEGLIDASWPKDPIHPDARGHRAAAEAILSELDRRGLLPH